MLENQAFGWLKNAIKGSGASSSSAGSDAAAISACSDPAVLVKGVAEDFNAALLLSASSANNNNTASTNATSGSGGAGAEGTLAAASSGEAGDADTTTCSGVSVTTSTDDEDLITARLNRIKTLLYEERSASSAAVAQSGTINLNWTPSVASSVFKSFTATSNANESTQKTTSEGNSSNEQQQQQQPKQDLIPQMIQNLPLLPFEARKSITAIFNYLLVCGLDGVDAQQFASVSSAFANYVLARADVIIGQLVRAHHCKPTAVAVTAAATTATAANSGKNKVGGGSGNGAQSCVDITLLCGSMLRSSLRHASIYQWILADGTCEKLVYPFLDGYVHNPNFDISSDALETVRVMFTGTSSGTTTTSAGMGGGGGAITGMIDNNTQQQSEEEYKQQMESIASDFLHRKYKDVIDDRINAKCLSPKANYMTRRMTLQLLSTILLNRANYNVMMMYISSSANLVTILCLLRDVSPHITLDAFQVFKIFVANPNKPPEVVKILFDNKVKLVKYLEGLHKDRENSDEQYRDEKQLVISTLEGLEI